MITLDLMTRHMAVTIGNQLKLEYKDVGKNPSQSYVSSLLSNLELSQTLDDLFEKTLAPAANNLLSLLVRRNARYSHKLEATKNFDCSIHWFNGLCIRGAINREYRTWDDEENELVSNAIRFDVLWSQ